MLDKEKTGYPSIDQPWLKYYTDNDLKIEVPKCTIYQNIYNRNKEHPNSYAINYYGNRIRYIELFDNIEKCAKSFCKIGIEHGDCVTLCTAGVPEAVYIILACSRIGAIANFINPLFSTDQMIDRINDTEAEWIFILDVMYSYIEKALSKTCIKNIVIIRATNSIPDILSRLKYFKSPARKILQEKNKEKQYYYSWKNFISRGQSYKGTIDKIYEKNTPTVMVYSSGTTGASKGILLTNDGINATISNYQMSCYPVERGDSFLSMIPIWFSTGNVLSLLMPLVHGITVVMEPVFSAESFLKDLKKYKPSMTLVATSIWIDIINNPKTYDMDLSNMKYPITGGEKVLEQDEIRMNEFLRKHGCEREMLKGYGMCELGSTVSASNYSPRYTKKNNGTGYPILNVIVSVFDIDTDEELKYGEHGEIRVCSPARMKGYYKNSEATERFFKTDKEGRVWGCTGDIGFVDEDGEVFILGRATDSYQRENGETVYLFDIEDEIIKEEPVNQCKVVDIKENGETKLVAHIVFKEGGKQEVNILRKIDSRIKDTLPEYMIPDYYKVRQSMPVHSNGKRDVETLKSDREKLIKIGSL